MYLVFSCTPTLIGKGIRFLTRNEYNHVSLVVDLEGSKMVSFGRFHQNTPLWGGFVFEQENRFIQGEKEAFIKVVDLKGKVDEQRILSLLTPFIEQPDLYRYNSVSAVTSLLHRGFSIPHAYTCVEFVSFLLDKNDVSVNQLEARYADSVIYEGTYLPFFAEKPALLSKEDDPYTIILSRRQSWGMTFRHFASLADSRRSVL